MLVHLLHTSIVDLVHCVYYVSQLLTLLCMINHAEYACLSTVVHGYINFI